VTGKSSKREPYITVAQAARELGITRQVLSRQVKAGQVRSRGGKVRLSEVRADRAAHVAPRPGTAGDEDDAEPVGELTDTVTTAEAKRHKEIELARLRRLDRQSREGELVLASVVQDTVFRCAREDRDALMNLPARIAPLIAAELGVDAGRLLVSLERHVREFLASRATRFAIGGDRRGGVGAGYST
jgi:hypothetical protein